MASPVPEKRILIKRTDLPIYDSLRSESESDSFKQQGFDPEQSVWFKYFKRTRETVEESLNQFSSSSDRYVRFFMTGYAHSQNSIETTVEYLREEKNILPRIGAVGFGTLVGYVLASRKGKFRKLIFSSVGAAGASYICFPEKSKLFAEAALNDGRKYGLIGYHFLNGMAKDYGGFELPNPFKKSSSD